MTVDKPHTRIIGLEGDSQVSSSWQKCYIPSRRVVVIECFRGVYGVIFGCVLTENDEVMTVHMDWMRNRCFYF